MPHTLGPPRLARSTKGIIGGGYEPADLLLRLYYLFFLGILRSDVS